MSTDEQEKLRQLYLEIQRLVVYGIYYQGRLMYIGSTRTPLSVRLTRHISSAKKRQSAFHRWIDDNGLTTPDLEIKEMPYIDEEQALRKHISHTLNTVVSTRRSRPLDYSDVADEALLQLGEVEDAKLAKEYNCPLHKLRNAREKLGIKPKDGEHAHTHIDWEMWDHKLGTISDVDLAEEIGCHSVTVAARRAKLGIEAHRGGWLTDEQKKEMADVYMTSDKTQGDVAEEYGVCRDTVRRAKAEYYGAKPQPVISTEQKKEMAQYYINTDKTQAEVADEYGVAPITVGRAHRKYNK